MHSARGPVDLMLIGFVITSAFSFALTFLSAIARASLPSLSTSGVGYAGVVACCPASLWFISGSRSRPVSPWGVYGPARLGTNCTFGML